MNVDYFKKIKNIKLKHLFYKYIYNNHDLLVYCRVGKCGSTSLTIALEETFLKNENKINTNSFKLAQFHLQKVIYKKKSKYVFLLRNPIERAISSFYHDKNHPIFKKYKKFNKLAELLYDSEHSKEVFNYIKNHPHIAKGFHYHLSNVINNITKNQIHFIFTQEHLNQEIIDNLNYKKIIHKRKSNRIESLNSLSSLAKKNLKKFLKKDYECMRKINDIKPIENYKLKKLLAS